MRRGVLPGSVACAVVSVLVASFALAGDGQEEKGGQDEAAMIAAWMKNAMPGEHHARLGAMAGKWKVVVKFWVHADEHRNLRRLRQDLYVHR